MYHIMKNKYFYSLALVTVVFFPLSVNAQIQLQPLDTKEFERQEYEEQYANRQSTVSTVRPLVIGRFTFDSPIGSKKSRLNVLDLFHLRSRQLGR
jgi:hypothetical protein